MSRPSRVASMRAAMRRSRVQDLAAWVVSAKPRTASLSSIARATRIASANSSILVATAGAGEAEDVIDAVRLAPVHDLRPTIVSVAADGDAGGRPMAAAVRRQAPAVEPSGELLAPDGWKPERQSRIVGDGGCG